MPISHSTVVAVLLIGSTFLGCSRPEGAEGVQSSGGSGGGGPTARPAAVAVAPAIRMDLARSVTVTGAIEPIRVISIPSQASGIVREVLVEEGTRVRAGDLLATLDDREVRAQLRRAAAIQGTARAELERAETLNVNKTISAVEYEEAKASFEIAASDVMLWETRVGYTRITAPSNGVVILKSVEAGNAVSTNQRIFEIADVSLLVVRVQVSEMDVVHLTTGSGVQVRLDAFPNQAVVGSIRRIFPSADPVSRLVPVEVALGPLPVRIEARSGFLARVTFSAEERPQVLVVPAEAVSVSEIGPYVMVVSGDTLVHQSVEVGLSTAGMVELLSGVEENSLVVTSGLAGLRPGMAVQAQGGT